MNPKEQGLVDHDESEHDTDKQAVTSRAGRQCMAAADNQVSQPKGMKLHNRAIRACPVPLHDSSSRSPYSRYCSASLSLSVLLMLLPHGTGNLVVACHHAALLHDECSSVFKLQAQCILNDGLSLNLCYPITPALGQIRC